MSRERFHEIIGSDARGVHRCDATDSCCTCGGEAPRHSRRKGRQKVLMPTEETCSITSRVVRMFTCDEDVTGKK